ncbi:hypothetical protein [Micromonospora sp. DT229]|uniref:hypothetical protein n=1 Tax=Micromonospora sp. DT229 TaxID=3393430 RepID=UPI003CF63756
MFRRITAVRRITAAGVALILAGAAVHTARRARRSQAPACGNVIPLPVGLDAETAAAVRRIQRRLASGQ